MTIRIALTFAALMTLTACEMMQGLGRDVETTGETIQQESVETQQGL
jgi:entericidin B